MTTGAMNPALRRLFAVRLTPSMFLLLGSYLCLQAAYNDTFVGRAVTSVRVSVWLTFFFSWLLPLLAIPIALFQLARHRSLQHVLEIGLSVWLLYLAFDQIVQA